MNYTLIMRRGVERLPVGEQPTVLSTLMAAIAAGIINDPVSKDFKVLCDGKVIGFHNHSGWHDICEFAHGDCPSKGNRASCHKCSDIPNRLRDEHRCRGIIERGDEE